MFLFILGIFIIIVVGFILGFNIPNTNGLIWQFKGRQLMSTIIGIIFIVLSCVTVVPTGHTGIISVFGTIKNNTLDAGLSFKAPWARIITMDNRIQKVSGEMTGTTSDMQDVTAIFTLNYQISKADASNIYKTIGKDYEKIVIASQTQNTVKAVLAKYAATSLVSSRTEVSTAIEKELESVLSKYNIEVVDTAIEDMQFSEEFNNSIEQKVIAEQNLERAKTEQEKLNLEIEQEAQRKITEANGTAKANEILSNSITSMILEKNAIEKWNGELPQVVGNDTNVFDISGYVK